MFLESLLVVSLYVTGIAGQQSLPEIDLGYSTYRATTENTTGNYYTFSNIRFAAPPVGNLRFKAPASPLEDKNDVIDGSVGYTCPQSQPGWWTTTFKELGAITKAIPAQTNPQQQNEDCLFLDVVAPKSKFDKTKPTNETKLSPVLIWIHGGGYFIGDKTTLYDPAGFFHQSNDDIVYMAMNYRLSSLGFLSGTNQTGNQTDPNVGLLDQRASFKWVQKYIHLFGGDAGNITIFGQSAGGGSVMHHTTWLGGQDESENQLIKRALAQSPVPNVVAEPQQRKSLDALLKAANASSVDDLRKLPPNSSVLLKANALVEGTAAFTTLNFGPWVDGHYIPDFPTKCYPEGKFIKDMDIMASNNKNDGILFTPTNDTTNADYDAFLKITFPYAPQSVLDYVSQVLYPPVSNGSNATAYNNVTYSNSSTTSSLYSTPYERLLLTVAEQHVICNPYLLSKAYGYKTHNYIFSVAPALHAEDLSYSFFDGSANQSPPTNLAIGSDLNAYITRFALTGDPNSAGASTGGYGNFTSLPKFPVYGNNFIALNLTDHGVYPVRDPSANARCDWWAKGLVYGGQY